MNNEEEDQDLPEIPEGAFLCTHNTEQVEAHLAEAVTPSDNPHLVFKFEEIEDDFKVHFIARGMDGGSIARAMSLFLTAINKYTEELEKVDDKVTGEDCND